ncbi:hypothetical protein [Streptomyces longispororuber]|uniref:hypothetical protein n=1 Tax=Streptomyces longispororuber TaxID=68230 RepID=UPI00210D867B|nr:hypothetical protein [Streptomyces longispororuber]MCQ4211342.1 hypothetical protein [Streptomyces longispororuber]
MHDDQSTSISLTMAQLTGAYWLSTPSTVKAHRHGPCCIPSSRAQNLLSAAVPFGHHAVTATAPGPASTVAATVAAAR